MDSHIKFRVSTEEKQFFAKRAEAQGLGLSEWIRLTLLAACKMKDVAAKLPDYRVDPDFVKKNSAETNPVVDPEKIAAFQRKTGMTAFDKRRK